MIQKLIILSILALPLLAQAVGFTAPITGATLTNLLLVVLRIMWKVFFAIAVVFFVIAGIQFITAMGDPNKAKLARNSVIFGVVGIIVAILAYSIVAIISNALT